MKLIALFFAISAALVRPAFGQTEAASSVTQTADQPAQQTPVMDIDAEALELRDPFKRPFSVIASPGVPVGPLESFSVEDFKMVGSIVGLDRVKAILLDPTGKTHIVSEKMKIGLKQGLIREIRATQVKVREKETNAIGKEESIDTVIKLISKSQASQAGGGN
jgi:type IV pilus assembly protein PilP